MEKQLADLIKRVEYLEQKRIYSRDIMPNAIKQRSVDGLIIFRGITSEKPSDGSTEFQCFYDETTKRLYVWNTVNEAWEYATFT